MQNHKDKYGAIRREWRETERAAVQAIVETVVSAATEPEAIAPAGTTPETATSTTAEAKPSVVAPEKEVAVNE